MCLGVYINSTPPTHPRKAKEENLSHAKHAHRLSFLYQSCLLLIASTSSFITHTKKNATLSSTMAVAIAEAQFHVLAVDDSLPDRKLIERLLKTSSFQVTTVDSGTKALEFLGLHGEDASISVHADHLDVEVNVNLIITDYCMPGMTGYDLLKKIKESSSLRDIPVVIMSSENIPSRINRCLEEGANEFFLKPVRLSDMSKLKPHIMKSRCKEHYHQEEEDDLLSNSDSNTSSNPTNNSSGTDTISNPTNNSSDTTDNSSGDSSSARKRKAEAGKDKISPKTSRPRHS